jgi:hypothetical protein
MAFGLLKHRAELYYLDEAQRVEKFKDKKWLRAAGLPDTIASDGEKAENERKLLACTTPNEAKSLLGDMRKKELAVSTANDGSASTYTLIQEVVYDSVLAGAEPFKCMREVVNIVNVPRGPALRVPYGGSGRYAPKVAEGGQPERATDDYADVDINIYKYMEISNITNEMVDDALYDLVELETRKLGFALENALNRAALDQIIDSVTGITPSSPAGAHIAITDIARNRSKVFAQNWNPDKIILHPTAEGYLLQDSNLLYVAYAGQSKTLESGEIPKMLGLIPYTCTATDSDSVWDDTTAGSDVTAFIGDFMAPCVMGAMKDDISLRDYEDPIVDLVNVIGKMRVGFEEIRTTAGVQIYHK